MDTKPLFGSLSAGVADVQLGSGKTRFVKLQNRNINDDGTINNNSLFYGNSIEQPLELVPGQYSDWLPVTDLEDVHVRTQSGTLQTKSDVAYVAANSIN